MSQPKPAERRFNQRRRVRGMPGQLYLIDQPHSLAVIPVDVSPTGIGVLTSENLSLGIQLYFLTECGKHVELELKWKLPEWNLIDLAGDGAATDRVFRCGLQTKDDKHNLEDIFFAAGCIV